MTTQKSSTLIVILMMIAGLACGVRDITGQIGQIALQFQISKQF